MKNTNWKPKKRRSLLQKIIIATGILGGMAAILAIGHFVFDIFSTTKLEEVGHRVELVDEKVTALDRKVNDLAEYLDGLPDTKNPKLKRLFEKGYALYRGKKYPEAIDAFKASLELKTEDSERLSLLILIGNAHWRLGNLTEAENKYHEARLIGERIGDKRGTALILGNLGLIYNDNGDLDQALKYLHDALKIDSEIGFREGQAAHLGNIGLIYQTRGNLDQALKCQKEALKIDKETSSKEDEAWHLGNIAMVYRQKGDLDQALKYHQDALKIDKDIGSRRGEAGDLVNMAATHQAKGDLQNALKCLRNALVIFEEIGTPEDIGIVRRWIEKLSRQMK